MLTMQKVIPAKLPIARVSTARRARDLRPVIAADWPGMTYLRHVTVPFL
jgi:hypothetical protein